MAWSVLQSCSGTSATLTATATFTTANLTAGSKLIAYVSNASLMTISTVKDGAGNSFSQVASNVVGTTAANYIYVLDTPAGDVGTKPVITVTWTGTANGGAVLVQEVSGLAAGSTAAACLDGTPGKSNGNATLTAGGVSLSLGAYASAASNEMLVILYADDGDSTGSTGTLPSGYTADGSNASSNSADDIRVYSKNSTGGTEAPTTITAADSSNVFDWTTIFVAFKLAASVTSGPVFRQARQAIRARIPRNAPRGRTTSGKGAPRNNPVLGPVFRQARQAIRAKTPLARAGGFFNEYGKPASNFFMASGRVAWSAGGQVSNPVVTGTPLDGPVRARIPQNTPRGRVASSRGAPVNNPVVTSSGPPLTPLDGPVRARIPQNTPRGKCRSIRFGAAPGNPAHGPAFEQATSPIRARIPQNTPRGRVSSSETSLTVPPVLSGPRVYPLQGEVRAPLNRVFSKGRVGSNAGAPVRNPTAGPVFEQATSPARARIPQVFSKGHVYRNPGAPVNNPGTGPVFEQATSPIRVRIPQVFSKGRVGSSNGAPVRNPTAGPVFRPFTSPVKSRQPLPVRGRIASNDGGPVSNPVPTVTGPVFEQATSPIRARILQNAPRGRVYSNKGAPAQNPAAGPVFRQKPSPVQARFPLPRRGRAYSNPGGPVSNPVAGITGPVFKQATSPARIRPSLPPRGRVSSDKGAPRNNPTSGPVFRQAVRPITARFPRLQPPAGRIDSNPGGPARNPTAGPQVYAQPGPARARLPEPFLKGRVASNKGAPVRNPVTGPVFRQSPRPVTARFPLPRKGRVNSNRGGPVSNPALITESGPFNIILPSSCQHFGNFTIQLPALRTAMTAITGKFGPLNIAVPATIVTLTGKHFPIWPGIKLPSLTATLTGKVYHSSVKPVLPALRISLAGVITHRGSFNILFGCPRGLGGHFFKQRVSLRSLPLPPAEPATWTTGTPGTAWKTFTLGRTWNMGFASMSISHLSTQYVLVPVQATKNGVAYNPTTDPVQFAFAPTATYVPQVSDWTSGSWVTNTNNPLYPYSARILVGPGATVLGIGSYQIYMKITDSPETPVLIAGQLDIT